MIRYLREVACLLTLQQRTWGGAALLVKDYLSSSLSHMREHVMGLLRLAVLGYPEAFHDSSRLTFSLRKALALLIYLAVEGGTYPRSKLAAFLWPDSEPHDARTALRNAIALLRSLLADADSAPAQHSH